MTKKKLVELSEIIDAEKLKNGLDIYTNINNNRKVIGKAPLTKDEKNDIVSLHKSAESMINMFKEVNDDFYNSVTAFNDLAQKTSYKTNDIILPEYERCYKAYNAGLSKLGFLPKDFNGFFYWYLSFPENENLTLGSITNFKIEDFANFHKDMVMRLNLSRAEYDADKPEQSTNAKFTFENKINSSHPDYVYTHFKKYLVGQNIITENQLHQFLKAAFELETPLINKIAMSDAQRKKKVYACFHTFYNGNKIQGNKKKYVELLSDFFIGYEYKNTDKNWSTYDCNKDVI